MLKLKDNQQFTQGAFMADSMSKALRGAPKKRTWGVDDEYRVKTGEHKDVSMANAKSDVRGTDGEADNTHDVFRNKSDGLDHGNATGDAGADSDDDLFGDADAALDRYGAALPPSILHAYLRRINYQSSSMFTFLFQTDFMGLFSVSLNSDEISSCFVFLLCSML
mgnify:CR=1 FL=1